MLFNYGFFCSGALFLFVFFVFPENYSVFAQEKDVSTSELWLGTGINSSERAAQFTLEYWQLHSIPSESNMLDNLRWGGSLGLELDAAARTPLPLTFTASLGPLISYGKFIRPFLGTRFLAMAFPASTITLPDQSTTSTYYGAIGIAPNAGISFLVPVTKKLNIGFLLDFEYIIIMQGISYQRSYGGNYSLFKIAIGTVWPNSE